VRLIEYMDVGNCNHWNLTEVVPSAEWIEKINAKWPIRPVQRRTAAETAQRYEYVDGQGEIGLISSISVPFCGGCTRARITADGIFYTCLFANKGTNLMPLVRHNQDRDELRERIRSVWERREDRYSEERGQPGHDQKKVEMYRMGG
ncbi:MAG: GTP 3',8-cyclase MoaA, partial [Lysobacterales bacterium]